ncbi:hypothetical protein QNO07_00570 [Streptomyces sp. 549]|uniref:hypothetical protein n=1 Tax=Streptomyces sp. 549 TaxID=3049076 RepID=UPI0024C29367|nr:hypothetical protein [Streptomyces sp. 549]MDK1471933.1 hypothetical protein [Streptomyces sp. 549]
MTTDNARGTNQERDARAEGGAPVGTDVGATRPGDPASEGHAAPGRPDAGSPAEGPGRARTPAAAPAATGTGDNRSGARDTGLLDQPGGSVSSDRSPTAAGTPDHGARDDGPRHRGDEESLVPHGERDKLTERLHTATTNFVDSPREAVQEADQVLEETLRQLNDSLSERHRLLKAALRGSEDRSETEDLRLALRQYRELTERLLHV